MATSTDIPTHDNYCDDNIIMNGSTQKENDFECLKKICKNPIIVDGSIEQVPLVSGNNNGDMMDTNDNHITAPMILKSVEQKRILDDDSEEENRSLLSNINERNANNLSFIQNNSTVPKDSQTNDKRKNNPTRILDSDSEEDLPIDDNRITEINQIKPKKSSCRINVKMVDSDSDDDFPQKNDMDLSNKSPELNNSPVPKDSQSNDKGKNNPTRILDSDSEEDLPIDDNRITEINQIKPKRSSCRIIKKTIDSDSEDDSPSSPVETENNDIDVPNKNPELNNSPVPKDSQSNDKGKNNSTRILDSDSEADLRIDDNRITEINQIKPKNSSSRIIKKTIDSDSEDDFPQKNDMDLSNESPELLEEDDSSTTIKSSKLKERLRKMLDSDSEDENDVALFPPQKSSMENVSTLPRSSRIDDELGDSKKQKRDELMQSLIDSDSSEDEHREHSHEERQVNEPSVEKTKQKPTQSRKGSTRASKNDAMKQIYSETQRLMRETEVSLPYHIPKQRSLQEFLNRKSIAPVLPKAPTRAAKLKLSSSIVSKVLEEKAKEAELFYKSDDSENENNDNQSTVLSQSEDIPVLSKATHVAKKLFQNELKECDEESDIVKEIIDNLIKSVETTDLTPENIEEGCNITKEQVTTEIQMNISTDDETEDFVLRLPDTCCDCLEYSNNCSKCSNNPPPKSLFDDDRTKVSNMEINSKRKFPNLFGTMKPTLKGDPGMVIDLTEDNPRKKNGIDHLIERFISKHSVATKQTANDSTITIVTLEESSNGFIPVKQDLRCTNFISENLNSESKKPGTKLLELRRELQQKIALKRCELVKQKETNEMELSRTEDMNDELDEDEDEEFEDEVSESGESEPEENDVIINDKKYTSHAFADDEAEVSEEEGENEDVDTWKEDDDEYNITRQNYTTQTQYCKTPLTKPSIFDLISPSSQISGINGTSIDSVRKNIFDKEESLKSIESVIDHGPRTKLFQDLDDDDTNEDELLELCSGKFISQDKKNLMDPEKEDPTESQLLNLCSGTFNSKTIDTNESEPENSYKNRLFLSSDDDDVDSSTLGKKKKFKRIPKKLVLSDDEESVKMTEFSDVDEEDSMSEDEGENKDEYIDYDSEENEIVAVPAKDIKKVAAGFLEEEAELSESEWGSADEDEQNLDEFELEEADEENIDENQMRDQIGKVQMRQMLDQDQRDVRILKEMLLEDGDLHTDGNGRERKFKWKNIDKADNENVQTVDEQDQWFDSIGNDDSCNWRKLKQERQSFLEKQVQKDETDDVDDDILGDSQIFQLGMKALKKTRTNQLQKDVAQSKEIEEEVIMSRSMSWALNSFPTIENKRLSNNPIHRHSLLARGDETLARLATVVKQHDVTTIKSKASRHFIFETISPSAVQKNETEETKDSTNIRKRKPPTSLTPKTVKKIKNDNDRSRGKQLFGDS